MKLGIYRLEGLLDEALLVSLEEAVGSSIDILSFYRAWNRCRIEDDLPWLTALTNSPREILLTWEPWEISHDHVHPERQPDFSLTMLVSGKYDRYIRDFARALNPLAEKIYLRPMHEMNGNWYPWCGTVNDNRPGDFLSAWAHLRRLFDEEGTVVHWVWSPSAVSFPDTTENRIQAYFPGNRLTDWLGLDGYNWGTTYEWSCWQDFSDIFARAYDTLITLSPHPIMIAETSSAEAGGDKGRWIGNAFSQMPSRFPRIGAFVWFDVDKECDWRIASSDAAFQAFAAGVGRFNIKCLLG